MKRLFGLLVLIWLGTVVMDAQSDAGVDLLFYADVMSNAELPESRMRAQKQFRKLLLEELQSGAVTEYDSIPWHQSIVPADSSFRLFTWQLEQTAGDFKYFGVIDLSGGQLVELQDKRKLNSEFSKYDQATWYGALYYGIESFQQEDGTTAHMLLGYNANDLATNIKVADIMTLNGDKVSFGAPVFKNLTDNGEEVSDQ